MGDGRNLSTVVEVLICLLLMHQILLPHQGILALWNKLTVFHISINAISLLFIQIQTELYITDCIIIVSTTTGTTNIPYMLVQQECVHLDGKIQDPTGLDVGNVGKQSSLSLLHP